MSTKPVKKMSFDLDWETSVAIERIREKHLQLTGKRPSYSYVLNKYINTYFNLSDETNNLLSKMIIKEYMKIMDADNPLDEKAMLSQTLVELSNICLLYNPGWKRAFIPGTKDFSELHGLKRNELDEHICFIPNEYKEIPFKDEKRYYVNVSLGADSSHFYFYSERPFEKIAVVEKEELLDIMKKNNITSFISFRESKHPRTLHEYYMDDWKKKVMLYSKIEIVLYDKLS